MEPANVVIPSLGAKKTQVGNRRFRTGYDDKSRFVRQPLPGGYEHDVQPRLCLERIEIVEICDPRQHRDGHDHLLFIPRRRALQHDRVFGRQQRDVPKPRHDSEATPPGEPIDRCDTVVEKREIAAKLVDDVARDHGPVRLRQDEMRAGKCRDDPAPVYVADEHDRHAAAIAKPILAMSRSRRLTSAGDPAPSTITRSWSAFSAPRNRAQPASDVP